MNYENYELWTIRKKMFDRIVTATFYLIPFMKIFCLEPLLCKVLEKVTIAKISITKCHLSVASKPCSQLYLKILFFCIQFITKRHSEEKVILQTKSQLGNINYAFFKTAWITTYIRNLNVQNFKPAGFVKYEYKIYVGLTMLLKDLSYADLFIYSFFIYSLLHTKPHK